MTFCTKFNNNKTNRRSVNVNVNACRVFESTPFQPHSEKGIDMIAG